VNDKVDVLLCFGSSFVSGSQNTVNYLNTVRYSYFLDPACLFTVHMRVHLPDNKYMYLSIRNSRVFL
jgi:hypothetical protein